MRFRLISFVFLLALAAGGAAAAPEAPGSGDPVFTAEGVRAHVEFLADDLLEGREAGTRGYDIAAHYVATRFDALGLTPAGAGGGWFQPVPLASYAPDATAPAEVTIGANRFMQGEDVIVPASSVAGREAFSANAVFVGYGLEADYARLDVKGKFVVALLGIPKAMRGSAAQAAAAEDKLATAARHGAIGLISLVTPGALRDDFRWDRQARYAQRAHTDWLRADGRPSGDGVAIQFYVAGKAATALFAGSRTSAEALYAELAHVGPRPQGFALAAPVTVTRTNQVDRLSSENVVALLPGSDPKLARDYVVLSAHLDHLGVRPGVDGPDKIFNGAMDNAAGVATMLEVARGFVESGRRPKRSILFVALTAEEEGLLGSEYLAQHPVVADGRPVADVNLDMPILLYDFTDVVAFGAEHSTLGPIVERAAAKLGVTLSPDPMPEENLFVRSDHYSFVKAGVPSVFLVTGFANGGEKAFRDFLATHYHKVSDQIDQPFDWAAGAKFAQINYLIARTIADSAQAPLWYKDDPFGDRYAPGQLRAFRPEPARVLPATSHN